MRLDARYLQELTAKGWLELALEHSIDLVTLARNLGNPVPSRCRGPLVDRLTPTRSENAHARSMSAVYGTGEFPFHTDGACFYIPPRFVVLRLAEGITSSRMTLLQDTRALPLAGEEIRILQREVWRVSSGRDRFLSSIFNDSLIAGHTVVRFDRCCMSPAHASFGQGAVFLERASHQIRPTLIKWTEGKIVILDNWRMLHARGPSAIEDEGHRILERVLVAALEVEP